MNTVEAQPGGRNGASSQDAGDPSQLPILDAHHHFWDLDELFYPWLQDSPRHDFFLGDQRPLVKTFLPADYRAATGSHRVVGTVHVEAEADRSQQLAETEWLTGLHQQTGLPSAIVAHAWFDLPDTPRVLAEQAAFELVRGSRSKRVTAAAPDQSVRGQRRSMQDPKWLAGYARLAEFGLSWDLRVPYWHLTEAARVAGEHPDIPVVLNHTGFPWLRTPEGLAGWRQGMRELARIPHVWVKLSCVCVPGEVWSYEAHRDVVREAIDIFGPQRCMFASNVPPDTLQASFVQMMDAYKAMVADFDRPEQERMFHGAAAEFYRVSLPVAG